MSEKINVIKIVDDLRIKDKVIFTGYVNYDLIPHYYNMYDVTVAIIWANWAYSIIEPLVFNNKLLITNESKDLFANIPNIFRVNPFPKDIAEGIIEALLQKKGNSLSALELELNWDNQIKKLVMLINTFK